MRCSFCSFEFLRINEKKAKKGRKGSEEIEKSRLRNNIHDTNGTRKVSVGNGKYEGRLKNVYCPVQDRVQGYGEKERKGEREREKEGRGGPRFSFPNGRANIANIRLYNCLPMRTFNLYPGPIQQVLQSRSSDYRNSCVSSMRAVACPRGRAMIYRLRNRLR